MEVLLRCPVCKSMVGMSRWDNQWQECRACSEDKQADMAADYHEEQQCLARQAREVGDE